MKKFLSLSLSLVLVLALLTGCGGGKGKTVLKVGASPTPHAEILAVVKDALAEKDIDLQVVEFTDYIQPNEAVESGELDANYFQHITYMNDFNDQNGTHLASVAMIHYEPFGIYAGKTASLDALAEGATVGIPNDPTNGGRALLLLQEQGLVEVDPAAGLTPTKLDITKNVKNIEVVELEAAQLPRSLDSLDLAVINGNYAIQGGLKVTDALAIESAQGIAAEAYGNIIAVKEGNENNEAVKALIDALKSDAVRDYISSTYSDGSVVAVF